ncbi:MAG TPA: PfkB family carbohydrate kinase [Bacteroidales bacterium]|nr:PfkB family carbohydrate kinase [Bacteroidales bacterium]
MASDQTNLIRQTSEQLSNAGRTYRIIAGLDGFVDEIIHVVDKREDHFIFRRIETIEGFAKRIGSYAGLSGNVELVPHQVKLGGNGPIYANMLLQQGHKIIYIGALGCGNVHPVFADFANACEKVITITEPGHTDALEFLDGKLMLGKMNKLIDVSWDNLLKYVSVEELTEMLESSRMIACNNWTMLGQMNSILSGMNQLFKNMTNPPDLFIDLADPAKRTAEDIAGVLDLLSGMQTRVILSMNLNESSIISNVLGISEEHITLRAGRIRDMLNLTAVVIHPVDGAAVVTADGSAWVEGPFTANPKLTTGAGDNFNAGFSHGWINNLPLAGCVATGVCTSGYYVRNGHSPDKGQLLTFMKSWADAGCGNI